MGPLALFGIGLGIVGTGAVIAAASSSGDVGADGVVPRELPHDVGDWSNVRVIHRVYPPPPPFYAPNEMSARYPLVKWRLAGDTRPVHGNGAIDVRGEPWEAVYLLPRGALDPFPSGPSKELSQFCRDYGDQFDPTTRTWIECGSFLSPDGWSIERPFGWQRFEWRDDDDKAWDEVASDFMQHVVIPAAITFAGAAIGGLGGAVTAFVAQSLWNVAMGQRFKDAVVTAFQDRLASEAEKNAYYRAFSRVVTTYKQTRADLERLRDEYIAYYKPTATQTPAVIEAINAGIGMGRSKQLQDLTLEGLKARITPEEQGWLEKALDHGVQLQDWTVAMFGAKGGELLEWLANTANAELDAGRDPMRALVPWRHNPAIMINVARAVL